MRDDENEKKSQKELLKRSSRWDKAISDPKQSTFDDFKPKEENKK
jgi:hypothetical protein